ncbi:MAG: glycosyltransferase [Actinomycetota bacterium]|nr:glycosyltransferase [Actinomycetota bacterium]
MNTTTIDLVLATVARTEELVRFFDSLESQSHRSFRLIAVDQNPDERLLPVFAPYEGALTIVRETSSLGLSRARNVGLRALEADVVAFPDDDCWYPPGLLRNVVDLLDGRPELDGVAGRTIDPTGRSSFMLWAKRAEPITRANVWRTAVAVTLFLRRRVVESVGLFDETLGVGSGTPWGSGEETDYVLRALDHGFSLVYEPDVCVYHESPSPSFNRAVARRAYAGGMGSSRVLRKHRYPWWFAAYRVLQLVAGSTLFLVRAQPARARFYWAMARGRAIGWVRSVK